MLRQTKVFKDITQTTLSPDNDRFDIFILTEFLDVLILNINLVP